MPPLVYKTLGSDDVTIRPFTVHKTQVLSYTSGSGTGSDLYLNTGAVLTDPIEFDPNTAPTNEDGSYQEPLYESVEILFYDSAPYVSRSVTFPAGGDGNRGFTPTGSVYVVNVAQPLDGEGVRAKTFTLDAPSAGSGSLIDDGSGRLYVSGSNSAAVGNIFYSFGVAVVNRLTSAASSGELVQDTGLYVPSGSVINVTFDATQTIYEYQVMATINPDEFNYSINPSAYGFTDDASGSSSGIKVIDEMATGSLSPYVTTIGLYNNNYQLLAIAKVPRAIKRLTTSQQSFVVRFDA